MRNKKGISLIVLVITIIVMIILAATIIYSIKNDNIIERAKDAVKLTNESTKMEEIQVAAINALDTTGKVNREKIVLPNGMKWVDATTKQAVKDKEDNIYNISDKGEISVTVKTPPIVKLAGELKVGDKVTVTLKDPTIDLQAQNIDDYDGIDFEENTGAHAMSPVEDTVSKSYIQLANVEDPQPPIYLYLEEGTVILGNTISTSGWYVTEDMQNFSTVAIDEVKKEVTVKSITDNAVTTSMLDKFFTFTVNN